MAGLMTKEGQEEEVKPSPLLGGPPSLATPVFTVQFMDCAIWRGLDKISGTSVKR